MDAIRTTAADLRVFVHPRIADFEAAEWNALAHYGNPFSRHEFLSALESNACLGAAYGWYPRHIAVRDRAGMLLAATPLYLKTNSYGEFVFDWAWADFYHRNGREYYPKLVSSIPYTPATGPRLLVRSATADADRLRELLVSSTIEYARRQHISGLHWLFYDHREAAAFDHPGLMRRLGCQYHWRNRGYRDFDHFLASLTSRKRKKIVRERRRVVEQGIRMHTVHGDAADDALWDLVHEFYVGTFERKSGIPTLSRGFFREVGHSMGDRVVLVLANVRDQPVACAINFRGDDTLYGRFWGCDETYHSLHFEACYYQGIDYCIGRGLARFEPGAQGEHKIARGFLPTRTWSAHWIADPELGVVLRNFCDRERTAMEEDCAELMTTSPYKADSHQN